MSPALNPLPKLSTSYMILSWKVYLGVTISGDLTWSTHIDNISKEANQTLGFLKRTILVHYKDLKSAAYKTLVYLFIYLQNPGQAAAGV